MFKYSRKNVLTISNENNFLTNATEKVLRLSQILNYINESSLNDCLALKGGTAINLFLLNLVRLSVDIDFDFSKNLAKEELLPVREMIKEKLINFMLQEGYDLSEKSKFVHSLDSFVFKYQTTSGSYDMLKIEINYSNRVHALDLLKEKTEIKLGEVVEVNRLANNELIGSKLNALIARTTPRDIYDFYNLIEVNNYDIVLVKKIAIFYLLIGSDLPLNFSVKFNECIKKIESINFNVIKRTLIPVLKKNEKINLDDLKKKLSETLKKLFILKDNEKKFIDNFNVGIFDQNYYLKIILLTICQSILW